MNNVKIALIQMHVAKDVNENIKTARDYITLASKDGAKIVCLPEMFCCPYENEAFVRCAESRGGYIYSSLSEIARRNKVILIGGSFPEKDGKNLYNTCFVFDENGIEIARHRKVHMFDIDIKGGQHFKESDTFSSGDDVTVFDTKYGKIGLMICFDIRFPEMAQKAAKSGAKMIFVPASFNMTTGPAHWELLFRTRALDNQLYMLGCAAAQNKNSSYKSYGHSIITSPWGEIVRELDESEGIIVEDIDLDKIDSVRAQLPVINL